MGVESTAHFIWEVMYVNAKAKNTATDAGNKRQNFNYFKFSGFQLIHAFFLSFYNFSCFTYQSASSKKKTVFIDPISCH